MLRTPPSFCFSQKEVPQVFALGVTLCLRGQKQDLSDLTMRVDRKSTSVRTATEQVPRLTCLFTCEKLGSLAIEHSTPTRYCGDASWA